MLRSSRPNLRLALPLLVLSLAVAPLAAHAGPPSLQRRYKANAAALPATALMHTPQNTEHLDEAHYTSVRDAALTMMERYPPKNHFYVSLGRSPVALYTFLRSLDPNMTTTFPASDLRLGINAAHHPDYFKHFEKYIPADVLRGDRGDIVVFDRSHDQSGTSLQRLKPLLEQYIASKGYKTKVVAVGFAAQGPLVAGVEHISTASFPKLFLYYNGADHDENVATYVGKHTIGTHAVGNLTANPQFSIFEQQMQRRMETDKKLDDALAGAPHLKALSHE